MHVMKELFVLVVAHARLIRKCFILFYCFCDGWTTIWQQNKYYIFLVNDFRLIWLFSRLLRDSTPRFVGQSVGRLVTLYFFYDFYFWTSLLLPKWSCDLKYGPCLPARDFGSRVSGLFVPFVCLEHYFQSANFVSVRYVSILSVLDAELSCLQCFLIWQCNEPACWMAICKLDTFWKIDNNDKVDWKKIISQWC